MKGRQTIGGLWPLAKNQMVYFIALETLLNVVFRLVPRACTVAMIATAMPAAIKPYSMAVAPDWSDRKAVKLRNMIEPLYALVAWVAFACAR
jgi:hypothetical protein